MNLAQAKAAVALLERANELVGDDTTAWDRIKLNVRDDEDLDSGIEVSLMRGGIGTVLILTWDGAICGELYEKDKDYPTFHENVEIALREDGTFTWTAPTRAEPVR